MVTYDGLIQFGILIVAIVGLVYKIAHKNKLSNESFTTFLPLVLIHRWYFCAKEVQSILQHQPLHTAKWELELLRSPELQSS